MDPWSWHVANVSLNRKLLCNFCLQPSLTSRGNISNFIWPFDSDNNRLINPARIRRSGNGGKPVGDYRRLGPQPCQSVAFKNDFLVWIWGHLDWTDLRHLCWENQRQFLILGCILGIQSSCCAASTTVALWPWSINVCLYELPHKTAPRMAQINIVSKLFCAFDGALSTNTPYFIG